MTEQYEAIRAEAMEHSGEDREMLIGLFTEFAATLAILDPAKTAPTPLSQLPPGIKFLSEMVRDKILSDQTNIEGVTPFGIALIKRDIAQRHESGALGSGLSRSSSIHMLVSTAAAAGYEGTGTVEEHFGSPPKMSEILVRRAIAEAGIRKS